jgi:hypothetical protein
MATNLFVMRGSLDLANGLHERVLYGNGDVASRVTLAELAQRSVILTLHFTWCRSYGKLKHPRSGG